MRSGWRVSPSAAVFGASAVLASAGAGLASPALVRIVARSVAGAGRPPDADDRQQRDRTGPGRRRDRWRSWSCPSGGRPGWSAPRAPSSPGSPCCARTAATTAPEDRATSGPRRTSLPPAPWFRRHAGLLVAALLLGAGSAAVWNLGRAVLVDAGAGRTASVVAWIALGVGGAAVGDHGAAGSTLDLRAPRGRSPSSPSRSGPPGSVSAPRSSPSPSSRAWCSAGATPRRRVRSSRGPASIDPEHAPSGTSMLFVTLVLGQAVGAAVAGAVVAQAGAAVTMLGAAVVVAAGGPGQPGAAGWCPVNPQPQQPKWRTLWSTIQVGVLSAAVVTCIVLLVVGDPKLAPRLVGRPRVLRHRAARARVVPGVDQTHGARPPLTETRTERGRPGGRPRSTGARSATA